jgi:hypothetical protein
MTTKNAHRKQIELKIVTLESKREAIFKKIHAQAFQSNPSMLEKLHKELSTICSQIAALYFLINNS